MILVHAIGGLLLIPLFNPDQDTSVDADGENTDVPKCKDSLNYTRSRLNSKFNTALRQTFIDASNQFNTIENNCRRRTIPTDISRVTCPPVENHCRPYFNDCKKNKIFNMRNQSNVSYNITQKEQYIRFVRGFGRNGHRRFSNGSQNFLFTNPNVNRFQQFNNNPNVLNICEQNIILPSVPEPVPEPEQGHLATPEPEPEPEPAFNYNPRVELSNLPPPSAFPPYF